jgi:DNA recombination protein RmuC
MDIPLVVILIVILAVNGVILWRMFRGQKGAESSDGLVLIQNQMNALTQTLDTKLSANSDRLDQSIQYQTSESNKIIREIVQELTKVGEGQKQVMSFTEQLQSLQDILKNPKQRGILGEYYLETLLKNVLPAGNYKMQYKLGQDENGKDLIPDAVVFVKDKIIPVDSKFSLENYNRISETTDIAEKARLEKLFSSDLKNRIIETSKYIQPSQGTLEFAFMFIPHEAIYYDLLVGKVGLDNDENLIQRAAGKYHVIIVSPTSFLAYLQTVLQGLNAMKIEEKAQDIIKRVGELNKHLKTFEDYHNKLGASLNTTVNHFMSSRKEFGKVDKDVFRITGEAINIEPLQIDKPLADE